MSLAERSEEEERLNPWEYILLHRYRQLERSCALAFAAKKEQLIKMKVSKVLDYRREGGVIPPLPQFMV